MEVLPKAGELIPDILASLARMPAGSTALMTEIAKRHGIDLPSSDQRSPTFADKFDSAVGFLVRSGFVGKERRLRPLHITKSGRSLLARLPRLDLSDIAEAIEPAPRRDGEPPVFSLSGKSVADLAKTDAVQAASREIAQRLISRLKEISLPKLYVLWVNAERSLKDARPEMQLASKLVLQAVAVERERRAALGLPASRAAFKWPSTEAEKGRRHLAMEAAADLGVLARMGYRVGSVRGVDAERRRDILARTFEGPLPSVPEAYAMEWGEPTSTERLKKLAVTIASLARNARRRSAHAMDEAISEWEEDLSWLRDRFYEGRYDDAFEWPDVAYRRENGPTALAKFA